MRYDDNDSLEMTLLSPRESLGVELKQWFDPLSLEGKAKIVKASIALRNNDGGILLLGITNDGMVDQAIPDNVEEILTQDYIQSIVSKYSSEPFEVELKIIKKDGRSVPVLIVQSGVKSPVACKLDLGPNGTLLRSDTVYVRTLNANNVVSSSAAKAKDWSSVVEICFKNREADIGAFVNRHLPGLVEHLSNTNKIDFMAKRKSKKEIVDELLASCKSRFDDLCSERKLEIPAGLGFREVAAIAMPAQSKFKISEDILMNLDARKPRHTGWPPFLARVRADDPNTAFVFEGGWESLIYIEERSMFGDSLDYWRIDNEGRFYCLRGLEDDMPAPGKVPQPFTQLDFYLQIARITEVISVLASMCRTLEYDLENTELAISCKWSKLKGRLLTSWVERSRHFASRGKSHQDVILTHAIVPLTASSVAYSEYVEQLVGPLFEIFGGMSFSKEVIDGIVQTTLKNRY